MTADDRDLVSEVLAESEALYRVALIAREAWQEPYETHWWRALGDALDAAGIDKEATDPA